jgi:hypothetical protein
VLFVALFTVGFWFLAHFLPPPSPRSPAGDIAALYQRNTLPIRLGTVVMLAAATFMFPFVAVIALQMKKMEGQQPILAYTQLASGSAGVLFFIVPTMMWTIAAFRPERDPQLILLLNDMGWLLFLMPFSSFLVQSVAIGLAILGDRSARPAFPRWAGFFNLWVGVLLVPGGIVTFFKRGPFAWDGLFGFWIPLLIFFAWYGVLFIYLRAQILREGDDVSAS